MVKALVDVHGVVDHVGFVEELDLLFQDLAILVETTLLEKLEYWEH